jgi:flagellar motor switch protein FliM
MSSNIEETEKEQTNKTKEKDEEEVVEEVEEKKVEEDSNIPKERNEKSVVELQLGDIIQIANPINEKLDNQTFIIDYIDKSKAYLINKDNL